MYLPVQNWHEKFKRNLTQTVKNLKDMPFNGLSLTKYTMFELGVIFDGTNNWCDIWRKAELRFQKSQEEFGKFSPENLKVSKLGPSWDPFIQSRKCMSLKFTDQ